MRRLLLIAIISLVAISCSNQKPLSGVDTSNFDTTVRPQDDFYHYVNGTWLKETELPGDKSAYGSFHVVYDETQKQLKEIIEEAAQTNAKFGSQVQKVGDFYKSYMDSATIEELGITPLADEIDKIDELQSHDGLAGLFSRLRKIGVQRPFTYYVDQDDKNSEEYILFFSQSGLGLPNRDYYFNEGERYDEIRAKYIEYVATILGLAGIDNNTNIANTVMDMETSLAKNHWTPVENRDSEKTYNKYAVSDLSDLSPNFNWELFFTSGGLNEAENVIIRQPSYFSALSDIISQYSVEDWRNYAKVKLLSGFANDLPSAFVDASFEFYGKTLRGTQENEVRWKRAVRNVDNSLGEVVGKVYVDKYFKPEAKERMVKLVDNLILSMEDRINKVDWMEDETKQAALLKLSKFNAKIGYPDKWKDYSALEVHPDELIQNLIRTAAFDYDVEMNKLGKPIDREEWFIPPQTVNAFYSPSMNEILFPAAILQPPFFNLEADDAVNYGAIGAAIGHEITHGFDDQGRLYDGDGNLELWWTEVDNERFKERAQVVVDQYSEFTVLDSLHVNGELTLGENIADIGGMTVTYNAYKMSLNGKESEVIDGFTGEQRVFLGWAQVWRSLFKDGALRERILTDPHSPGQFRVVGVMNNMPEFYEAFDVKEGDGHYLPEEERVHIW